MAVVGRRKQHVLVVAHKASYAIGSRGLQRHQELDDAATIVAAVDVISEED
jgi:hypothetical protein